MTKEQYIRTLLLAVTILSFLFFWYEFRPSQIKKECSKELTGGTIESPEFKYKRCLREKGL